MIDHVLYFCFIQSVVLEIHYSVANEDALNVDVLQSGIDVVGKDEVG
jgi:hypothetical protein